MIKTESALKEGLDAYIKEHHTQEECIGFIDGFTKAVEQLNIAVVSNRRELLIAFMLYLKKRSIVTTKTDNIKSRVNLFLKSNL